MYRQRLKIFLAIAAAAIALVLVRLAYLEGSGGTSYRQRGTEMLSDVQFLPTVRGQILDRRGRVLAHDQACYDFCLDYPMLAENPPRAWWKARIADIQRREGVTPPQAEAILNQRIERTWELGEQITGVARNDMMRSAESAARRIESIRRAVGMPIRLENQPQTIVMGLDEAQAVALRDHRDEMVGASVQPSHRRHYPAGDAACHLIGTIGQVGPDDRHEEPENGPSSLEDRLTRYFEGDLIGKGGAEQLGEELLRGRRGYRRTHTNGSVEEVPARFGQDLHLTVDIELQQRLAAALGRPGAIVVLDVATSEVLAMVSLPTYDLNEYRRRIADLLADKAELPLLDRTIGARYPPGSTIKPIVALAALMEKVIVPETTFECRGYLKWPGEFRCYHNISHGMMDLTRALEQSCNVYFYNVGERIGVPRLEDWLARAGYAEPPGTGLPSEVAPHLPQERRPTAGTARLLAIGQGAIVVTPMHVVSGIAAVARGGMWLSPVVAKEMADRQRSRRLEIDPANLAVVREGMRLVVNSPHGTAYKTAHDDEIEISGKTGTAQVPPRWRDDNGNGRRDPDEPIVKTGDTAWFAGFAPSSDPKIAFVVMIEYTDQTGGAACGPIGRQVVHACQELGYLP